MKAKIQSWEIKELGPAFHYGVEEPDGSHSYPAMTDVSLRVRIVGGDDAQNFLSLVKQLAQGATLKSIEIAEKPTSKGPKYIFK